MPTTASEELSRRTIHKHLPGACAEGHADADLAGAAGYVVGHDAVDADAGEDESEDAEEGGEGGEESLLRDGGFDLFGLGADVAERQILVDGLDGVAEGGEDGNGGELGFDDVGHGRSLFGLAVEAIEGRWRVLAELVVFGVHGDSDDLVDEFIGSVFRDKRLADGVDVWVIAVSEGLVNDGDERRAYGIGGAESAAIEDGDAVGLEEVLTYLVAIGITAVLIDGRLICGPKETVGPRMREDRHFGKGDGLDAGDYSKPLRCVDEGQHPAVRDNGIWAPG